MTIDDKNLRGLYQSHVAEESPMTREACPSVDRLLESFDADCSREAKDSIVDHISHCALCAQEFDFIRRLRAQEKALTEDLEKIKVASEAKIRKAEKARLPFFRRLAWKYAPILAVIIAIIGGVIFLHQGRDMKIGRGKQFLPLSLIQPLGRATESLPLVFKWQGIKGGEFYKIEIYDEALRLIWESPKAAATELALPPSVQTQLTRSKTYFWCVTAFGQGVKIGESEVRPFQIAD
ncbi:MAG: anti-sigma factor [Candidatus Aminicenantales bacterium]